VIRNIKLLEDLQTLGKALARKGTYKQRADAAFHGPSLKNCLIKRTLEGLCRECICCLKVDLMISKTWKERAPLFYFLMTCMCNSKE